MHPEHLPHAKDPRSVHKDREFTMAGNRNTVLTIPWRAAVDFWAQIPVAAGAGGFGTLARYELWARTGSTRVLVAARSPTTSGDQYIVGARNIVCDNFDLDVFNSSGALTPSSTPPIHAYGIGWGENVTGPPIGIPQTANTPETIGDEALQPNGGAAEWGGGARHNGFGQLAFTALVIAQTPALLVESIGYNTTGALIYVGFYDRLLVPVAGNTPSIDFPVPANAPFSWTPKGGKVFANLGIVVAASSTPRVYTAIAGTPMWADTTFFPG